MNKIKEIEFLIGDWKAAKVAAIKFKKYDSEKHYNGGVKALEAALAILNEPSNTQMQLDKKTCHRGHIGLKMIGDRFCSHCGMSFYD